MKSIRYPVTLPLPDGPQIIMDSDEDVITAYRHGWLQDGTIVFDKANNQFKAIHVPFYRVIKKELWVGTFDGIVWLAMGLPALILIPWSYFSYEMVAVGAILPITICAFVFAVCGLGYYTYQGWTTLGYSPCWCRSYLQSAFGVLVLCPLAVTSFAVVINCFFDYSPMAEHQVNVLDKHESHTRGRRGRRLDSYTISVSSWRTDMRSISIDVSSSEYGRIAKGSIITVATKPGLLGIEHFVENSRN